MAPVLRDGGSVRAAAITAKIEAIEQTQLAMETGDLRLAQRHALIADLADELEGCRWEHCQTFLKRVRWNGTTEP